MFNSRFTNTKFTKNNNKNNIITYRKSRPNRLLASYHNRLKSYIKGLLHPEQAVTGGFIAKAPNYVSVPTSNITFREAFDIVPDANGEFILYWTPNFLCTDEIIYKRGTNIEQAYQGKMEYSRNWLGGFDNNYNKFCYVPMPSYKPPASFVKYRLVSAGCKITYKGPTIQRAGIISHCLSYRPFPVTYFVKDYKNIISAEAISQRERLGSSINEIETTSIQNGMWSVVKNVQNNQNTFTVAVPTDPSDFIFEDDGYFYAAATAVEQIPIEAIAWQDGNGQNQQALYWPQLPEDGTPCSYIFKGTDLTSEAKLYVEQFYNFEVIPTEESAPVLRPRQNSFNSSDMELSKTITNKVLNATKGEIADDFAIDNLLRDSIQSLPSFISNFENQPERDNANIYTRKIVPKKPNNSAIYSKPNIFKRAWSSTKTGVKNVGKKVFTKDNAKFAANLLGQILAGYTGAK
jgi:hypothetical protein